MVCNEMPETHNNLKHNPHWLLLFSYLTSLFTVYVSVNAIIITWSPLSMTTYWTLVCALRAEPAKLLVVTVQRIKKWSTVRALHGDGLSFRYSYCVSFL